MEQHFWAALSASVIAAAVTTIGIIFIRQFAPWSQKNATYFASFAAGFLITISFIHLIPKSFVMSVAAPVYLLLGYLFMYFSNRFITAFVCDKATTEEYAIGLVPMLGIGFHSFVDGIIYSITFTASIFTGVLAATGMVLHEFPEGIIAYVLLLRAGFSNKKAMLMAFLSAALTTPVGMLLSYPWVSRASPSVLGILLAIAAGALVYVGATHLLPHTEREPRRYSVFAFVGGILIALLIVLFS